MTAHELVKIENTEEELKRSYRKVGEHLYINKNIRLNLESLSNEIVGNCPVVFLMGGVGTRLLHKTNDKFSKHMIEVNGQPISRFTFEQWRRNRFSNFAFLIDDTHRGNSIKNYYKDGKLFKVRINYSVEHGKLGSGGALKLAVENNLIRDSFVAHFPDDIVVNYEKFPIDFLKICRAADELEYEIVIVCVPGTLYAWGEVLERDGKVIDFVEKPFIKKNSNVGIFWISEKVFPRIKALDYSSGEVKIERTVFKQVAQRGKMLLILLPSEYWIPVNDDNTLKKFEETVKSSQS